MAPQAECRRTINWHQLLEGPVLDMDRQGGVTILALDRLVHPLLMGLRDLTVALRTAFLGAEVDRLGHLLRNVVAAIKAELSKRLWNHKGPDDEEGEQATGNQKTGTEVML